ncbi:uncharacterized protein TRUGW13939_11349 [Talaromyces rugulosus]|uniref:Knr4/Smi1-like domain-containing protein n=1 Tax=Talaromyces rugulosus TaxID=121627 RepID=A0A7H8RD85_TALRU|nr:uncharacterized protein TRUGW13939_11349 [Talaromyces rugulosus]QKX64176.1 hypothetical protein TRUGW13939_11349 [Talaromyces rugulosus]
MTGFLQSFSSRSILSDRSTTSVASSTAFSAVELGMLGCIEGAHSIIALLAEHSKPSPPADNLTGSIPDAIHFMYESTEQEITRIPSGVGKLDNAGLDSLEQKLNDQLPYLADGVDVVNGNEKDYETLYAWIQELETEDAWLLDVTTGYSAMRLSSGLAGLLNLALHLQKPNAVADQIMSRIAGRIHANQQAEYLARIRPAWSKYFVSGWLRDKLGLSQAADSSELSEYGRMIHDTTKKRLEQGGPLKPVDEYKDKSMQEMLAELDRNTVPYKDSFEEWGKDWDDDDDEAAAAGQNTILRNPATPTQIATAEETIGRPLPDDLKQFYALTNGTRPVVEHYPGFHAIKALLLPVESLFWEDEEYMHHYTLDLLPGTRRELPIEIEWPGIEGGAIAMYEHEGQGTDYVWYVTSELVAKARKLLEEAYEAATANDKKYLDSLVQEYHGSWDKLKDLKGCWYQQQWGDPDSMIVFHDFRAFLSTVVSSSVLEENKSPIKMPKD